MKKTQALLATKNPIIMGILNITPDSFSDGGAFFDKENAMQQFLNLKNDGSDIIDVGAESTGPGSTPIGEQEEIKRLEKVLTKDLCSNQSISIDTYRAATAKTCLELGAEIINDVSALRADKNMAKVISEHNAHVVLMFSKQADMKPNVDYENIEYKNIIKTISDFLKERINYALSNGIAKEKIILDPGMGSFLSAKANYSWEVLKRLDELKKEFSEFPILIGTSRKGFLGGAIESRDPLSQLTSLFAYSKGAKIIRTHNPQMANIFHNVWKNLC